MIERALHSLGGPTIQLVENAVRRQHLVEKGHYLPQEGTKCLSRWFGGILTYRIDSFLQNPEDRFLINELGSPGYIQDIFLSNQQHHMDSQSSSTSSPKSINSNYHPLEVENYLQFYLIQIQPYFPLFVPSHFNVQYTSQEVPSILIYAMCALAAYFQQQVDIADIYHQKVMTMLDEAIGRPSISLVQTLLLLVKYIECTEQHYFFERTKSLIARTKSLIARTIEVCKILKLQQQLVTSHPSPDPNAETRKRTFCMVFTYNTLIW